MVNFRNLRSEAPGVGLQFASGLLLFLGLAQVSIGVAFMFLVIAVIEALLISRKPRHQTGPARRIQDLIDRRP